MEIGKWPLGHLITGVLWFAAIVPPAMALTWPEAKLPLWIAAIGIIAVSIPLASMLRVHERLAMGLAARNQELRRDMTVFGLAETLAGIGRWRLDFTTMQGELSPELKRMLGFPSDADVKFDEMWSVVPDGGADYRARFKDRYESRMPWRHEFTICQSSGECRILQSIAVNEFDDQGCLRENIGVVIDVTDQRRREEALDQERARAMRLAAEANVLAQTDPLTGLANRRRTLGQLGKCVSSAEAMGEPFSLVTFDIDHFKQVNDSYGHQMGDDVLVRVAGIACGQMRDSDLLGRTGGEEFVWLLPGATADVAWAAAERLRQRIERESAGEDLPPVTVSIGHATWREGEDVETLLGRADAALYAAKSLGRNRVRKAA